MAEISNDNDIVPIANADPHGKAAILLVESLIHGLIEREVLSVADAVEIIDVAAEVKGEIGEEPALSPARPTSIDLLEAISASLRPDMTAI